MVRRTPDRRCPPEGDYRGWRHAHPFHGMETDSRPEEREIVTEGRGTPRAIEPEESFKPSKWITRVTPAYRGLSLHYKGTPLTLTCTRDRENP